MRNRFTNVGLELLIGIPGSGKSTYINDLLNTLSDDSADNVIVVSPDAIRRELTGSVNNIYQDQKVWEVAKRRVIDGLRNGNYVLFDATNVNTKYRKRFCKDITNAVKNFTIYGKVFDVDPEVSKQRITNDLLNNVDRSNVPFDVIDRMYQNYLHTLEVINLEDIKLI